MILENDAGGPMPPKSNPANSWGCRCFQCGHEWIRRTYGMPKECPKCKSYRWNDPLKKMVPIGAKIAKPNPKFPEPQKNAK